MQPGLSKVSFEVSDEAYLIGLADDDPFLVRLDEGLRKMVIFFLQKMKAKMLSLSDGDLDVTQRSAARAIDGELHQIDALWQR